ncbi:hypothetical protein [Gordonia sp. NPDC058843]|uniref:hypothetical protein n=1 Tax=Gordonia sp. NPDC058843 TaxID=3346648 RepID=UPI0036A71BAC
MRKMAVLMVCAAFCAVGCILGAGLALTWNTGPSALTAGVGAVAAGGAAVVLVGRVRAENRRHGTNYTIFTI